MGKINKNLINKLLGRVDFFNGIVQIDCHGIHSKVTFVGEFTYLPNGGE